MYVYDFYIYNSQNLENSPKFVNILNAIINQNLAYIL